MQPRTRVCKLKSDKSYKDIGTSEDDDDDDDEVDDDDDDDDDE